MSVLDKLASKLGCNNDVPNQELAGELAASGDTAAVAEIVSGLKTRDKAVQSDCIKVLYELGYLKPELIAGYAGVFLDLLCSKNNRLVWGSMIALAAAARADSNTIKSRIGEIVDAMNAGSVITVDNGVRVLAAVSAHDPEGSGDAVNYLLDHLRRCRASEVPQHAESSLIAANPMNKAEFTAVLKVREQDMTPPQMARLKKIYKALDKI
jgi:hypothetical protein